MAKMGMKAPKAPKPGAGAARLSDGTTRTKPPAAMNPLGALLGAALGAGKVAPPGMKNPARMPKPKRGGGAGLAIGQRPQLGARTKAAMRGFKAPGRPGM